MIVVVDSSIIVKWFAEEEGHEKAALLLDSSVSLICPEHAIVEFANALRRKARRGEISTEQIKKAVSRVGNMFDDIVSNIPYLTGALRISEQIDHDLYDCIFLAVAGADEERVVVTDDRKFAAKAVNGGFGEKIMLLDTYAAELEAKAGKENG